MIYNKRVSICVLIITLILCLCSIILIINHRVISYATAEENYSVQKQSNNDDLNFTLIDGGTAYKVGAANRSAITSAIIPITYNNLPVTQITDNGFMSCPSLKYVFVPSSITVIGNNAFMNCASLERVIGMSNVSEFGNNVFSMCSKLDKLILPENITTLGTNVIRNVSNVVYARATETKMSSLNPNWNYNGNIVYGNTIVYEDYVDENGVEGYKIADWQILAPQDDPLIIYSWCYADEDDLIGKPLLDIGQGAFNLLSAPSITIKHPDNSNLNHSINIEGMAFSFTNVDEINIETNITLKDEVYDGSLGLFLASTINSVTLPDSLTYLPYQCFSECVNLYEIKNVNTNISINHLSSNIKIIEDEAFSKCYSLPNLYIENTIEYIGDNVFTDWGTNPNDSLPNQNIYINIFSEGEN